MASAANEVESPVSEKIIEGHGQQLEGYPHNSRTANEGFPMNFPPNYGLQTVLERQRFRPTVTRGGGSFT
jgi:hypothetical protein